MTILDFIDVHNAALVDSLARQWILDSAAISAHFGLAAGERGDAE